MAHQEWYWQDFYEKAWSARAQILDEHLQKGFNSYQAIKALEKRERLYGLCMDNIKGDILWERNSNEQGDLLSFAEIPVLRTTVMNDKDIIVPYYSSFNFYDLLIDIFDETGPYDSIVELGCGYGRNLFEIFYRGGGL